MGQETLLGTQCNVVTANRFAWCIVSNFEIFGCALSSLIFVAGDAYPNSFLGNSRKCLALIVQDCCRYKVKYF